MDLRPPLALLDAADATLATGIIAGAVTLAADPAAPLPEWIKITPAGKAQTRDGRSYSFDPARLAARYAADAIELPVDTNHSVAILAPQGRKPDVVGWIRAVEARGDGTYGRVGWDDPAAARATLASHRYVSPTIHHDSAGVVTWVHSVALVSAPALGNMPALAHALPHQDSPMKEIAKALGLAETSTEAECLAALRGRTALQPLAAALKLPETADASACLAAIGTLQAGAGDKTLVATLQAELTATNGRLAAVVKAGRDRDVSEMLGAALKDLKILPTDVEHYTKLCASDDGLATVRAMMASRVPLLQPSGLGGLTPPTGDGAIDPQLLAAKAQKLKAEIEAAGGSISIADAVIRVQHQKA